jgi:thiosulfate/3-mercaptopyruvate sulfurtransferase
MSRLLRAMALLGCLFPVQLSASSFPALVDSTWLARNPEPVVILDVRTRAEYQRGHWPGARWAGFRELPWQVTYNDIPGYIPNDPEFSELLGGLGLYLSDAVVVVGSAGQPERVAEATRVVWSLMMAGVQQVALLDGGIESVASDDLVDTEPTIISTRFTVDAQPDLFLAHYNDVEGLVDDNGIVVDFRPTPYFDGERRSPQVQEAGTILEAVGFPPGFLLDEVSGRFVSLQEMTQDFEKAEIPLRRTVATFSDTGVWAALGWFALHRLMGNTRARLYDGSMVEWIDWGGDVYNSTDGMGGAVGG